MGFSFGGLSSSLTVMKNENIKAFVSLDGTERYNYTALQGSPYFDLDRFTIPYLHMAQKVIPEQVLEEDQIPEELNHQFKLFDSSNHATLYRYRFHNLSHAHFSTYGVLFSNRDPRQNKTDSEIMASYDLMSQTVLEFLNAKIRHEQDSETLMDNKLSPNKSNSNLISKKVKNKKPQ